MVQKAKLDVLENLPGGEITDANLQHDAPATPLYAPLWKKWALNKLLLVGAPVFIVLLVVIGGLLFYFMRTGTAPVTNVKSVTQPLALQDKKTVNTEKINLPPAGQPIKVNTAYLKDFIIDLKDKAGKSKILLCDIVFDLTEEKNTVELENRKDIRKLVCQTAASRNAIVLRSIEERRKLKNELREEVNKMLGGEIVKNIYFLNYVIM